MTAQTQAAHFERTALRFDATGLLPVVAQDVFTGRVLMLAWANAEAVDRTLATGEAHFWSRSRNSLWRKGESSGNSLRVLSIEPDCDRDSLLLRVLPAGPACHTGAVSCFDGESGPRGGLDLAALERIVGERAAADPATSYTAQLFEAGIERMAQKVGEEATEVVIAALVASASAVPQRKAERLDQGGTAVDLRSRDAAAAAQQEPGAKPARQRLIEEASDLLFHLTVLLAASGVTTGELAAELAARHQRGSRGKPASRAPLLEKSATRTPGVAEQSEPTDPPSIVKEEA